MAKRQVKFELSAVDRTKAAFNSVTKGLKGVGGVAKGATMGVAKVGIAATATATAISALAKVNIDFMDKLGKTSSKLGITAEFLQNMRFAAEQTGVKVEALDMGLQRFIRRAAEAAQGTGEAKRAFEQLGIELKNDDGTLRDVRDVLFDVADGLKNTSSSGEQVRLAFKFFDSEGVSLVNTLKNGADGLRQFEEEAENLGIIISSQSIKKAEMFADSLNVLKKQITAVTANVTSAFIPILEDIATKFTDTIAKAKGAEEGFEGFGKQVAITVLEFMKQTLIGILSFINEVEQRLITFASTKIGKQIFGDIGEENQKVQAEFDKLKDKYDALMRAFMGEDQIFLDIFGDNEAIVGAENLLAEMTKVRAELIELDKQLHGENPEENPIVKVFDAAIKKVQDFKLELKEKPKTTFEQEISEKVQAFSDSIGVTQDNISNLTINTMKNFEDRIVEGLKNGKLAFKDFADYVIEQILRIAIQEAILKPITGSVESFFGNIFGNKSLGGSVKAGTPYLVGETGREVFVPNQDGQILSNTDLRQSGDQAPTVNFNISTIDAAGFDELLATRKNMIISMVNQAYNSRGKMGIA